MQRPLSLDSTKLEFESEHESTEALMNCLGLTSSAGGYIDAVSATRSATRVLWTADDKKISSR